MVQNNRELIARQMYTMSCWTHQEYALGNRKQETCGKQNVKQDNLKSVLEHNFLAPRLRE